MIPRAETSIRRTSFVAAGLGAILSPIPLADELLMLPLSAGLALSLGRAYGVSPLGLPWKPLAATATAALVARAGMNAWTAFLPGVAAVVNATTAAAYIQLYGRYVVRCLEQGVPAEMSTAPA